MPIIPPLFPNDPTNTPPPVTPPAATPSPSVTRPPNTPPPVSHSTPPSVSTPPATPTNSASLSAPTPGASASTPPALPSGPSLSSSPWQSQAPAGNANANGISTPSPSTTPPPGPENHNTIKYIGYAAGGLLAVAVLIALIMFIMKRVNKRREDEALGDVFDRNSFVRDSVVLPGHSNVGMYAAHGEDVDHSERGRPRPPTMIDRHLRNANNNAGAYPDYSGFNAPGGHDNGGGYYGNNGGYPQNGAYDQYGNLGYDNYGVQQQHGYDQYAAPQAGFYQDSPMHSPMGDHFDHNASGAQYLNHQVGAGGYDNGRSLTRQPSGKAAEYPNLSDLGRGTSVTPFQAAQYAEIGRKLDEKSAHGHGSEDAHQAYAKLDRQHPGQKRVEDDDAYGGI